MSVIQDTVTQKETARSRLSQKRLAFSRRQILIATALGAILLLGAFLRFYRLGSDSIGNTYYAATVQSMLTSWRNFFFGAFEPGGSVSVDKPPLAFWIQSLSAYLLGLNGFALALPQALAGVLSIALVYRLVRRPFGAGAGLLAALALAVTPVTVSTERNNTMDGLLVFVLLLAAWAFLRAVRGGRLRYLLLGAFLAGLGFNIKMLQAFLPLPAFYAVYLLGAPHGWWKRIAHLALATLLLLAVSLAWAVAVDLTPPKNRPYVGSSTDNSVLELILGHNGLSRLLARSGNAGSATPSGARSAGPSSQSDQQPGNPPPPPNTAGALQSPANPLDQPSGPAGSPPPAPGQSQGRPQPPAGDATPGGPTHPRTQEVGEPGLGRLLNQPLATEAGWLLPLALLGLPLAVLTLGWRWPLSQRHLGLVLWAGWLLPELAYFSLTSGLFHAYYLVMLGPPLAALAGVTAWALGRQLVRRRWLALLAGVTIAFQADLLAGRSGYDLDATLVACVVLAAVLLLGIGLALATRYARACRIGLVLVLLATLLAPLAWSTLTAFNTNANAWLPKSGPDDGSVHRPTSLAAEEKIILNYLLAHTGSEKYLVATLTAPDAAPFILATGRPVLTFGGFSGSDDVVNVPRLEEMVSAGQLRFVLGGNLARQKPDVAAWLDDHCQVTEVPGLTGTGPDANADVSRPGGDSPGMPGGPGGSVGATLYDCAGQ
jgi:4-amino-4-deoxy-L-arabinose transferase-like glycosyltransferase